MSGTQATRIGSRVTTVSWIPSESVVGPVNKTVFATLAHYDGPPADVVDGGTTDAQRATLETWRTADRFRFANQLSAWIDVDRHGEIVGAGYDGCGLMGSTTLGLAARDVTFAGVALPDVQREPTMGDGWVRFVQSTGGRTGAPMPRRIDRPPFVQFWAPLVWTTLSLTIHADGRTEHEVIGASPFPRHWVFDSDGRLVAKVGTTEYSRWYRKSRRSATPWGNADSPALVTAVESALERTLAESIMRGGRRPKVRTLRSGRTLVEQGAKGADVYLLLDGVLVVEVDGVQLAELGPGAVVGERAVLQGGFRTAALRAATDCRVAATSPDDLDVEALRRLAADHHREHSARRV